MEIRRAQPGLLHIVLERPRFRCVAITPEALAERLGVSRQTVERWVRERAWPRVAELAIRGAVLGCLLVDPWREWSVDVETARELVAPNGETFNAGYLEYRAHLHTHVAVLRDRCAELEAELTWIRAAARAAATRGRVPARAPRRFARAPGSAGAATGASAPTRPAPGLRAPDRQD